MGLLLWLELTRLKNALIQLTRSPIRLLAGAVFALMMVCGVGSQIMSVTVALSGRPAPQLDRIPDDFVGPVLYAILLFAGFQLLYMGLQGQLFSFSVSDVDYLFPAPVSRRIVLGFQLALDYLRAFGLILVAIVFTSSILIGSGGRHLADYFLIGPIAVLLYVAFLTNLGRWTHLVCLGWWRGSLWISQFLSWGLGITLLMIIGLVVGRAVQDGWSVAWKEFIGSFWANGLFFPITATWRCLSVAFTGWTSQTTADLLLLVLLVIATIFLLFSRDWNFYEPSIRVSKVHQRIREAFRTGDLGSMVTAKALMQSQSRRTRSIPAFGTGTLALIWRDWAMTLRSSSGWVLFLLFLCAGWTVIVTWLGSAAPPSSRMGRLIILVIFLLPHLCLAYSPIVAFSAAGGGFSALNRDLMRLDIIKALPLPPWALVIVRPLNATIGFTLLAFMFYLMTLLSRSLCPDYLLVRKAFGAAMGMSFDWALLVLAAAPSFVFLAHSLSSLTAVLFPKATDPAQRFLVSFFFFFTGSLVILPSFIIAIFTWALISITGAVFLFHLVNAIISVVIISWAGRVLSRLEPTE